MFDRCKPPFFIAAILFAVGMGAVPMAANAQELNVSSPKPSDNGALHYHRAILALSVVPLEERKPLAEPIWNVFGESTKDEISQAISQLALHSRHAIRAARKGTDQADADFGIDYADIDANGSLPHAQPMLQLGRLLTLVGIGKQIDEDWENAAELFFSSMRLGAHMAKQPTLIESLVGVEVFENNYYALAFWATKCPDIELAKKTYARLQNSNFSVKPARTIAYEAKIVEQQIEALKGEYPKGDWSEMLLASLGEYAPVGASLEHHAGKTKEICIKCGMPATAFASKAAFDSYIDKIRDVRKVYLGKVASCMSATTASERLQTAAQLTKEYAPQFKQLGDNHILDAPRIAGFYLTHSAQMQMAQVAIAASANRSDGKFPGRLQDIKSLDATSTKSVYDGSEIEYKALNGGKDISIRIRAAEVAGTPLPVIEFTSVR